MTLALQWLQQCLSLLTQVLIVLELMPNSDLKNYLGKLVVRYQTDIMVLCIPIVLIIVLCCSIELMTSYIFLVSS